MSDPVTNIDIEDVLSSIRRLVSEGGSLHATSSASASKDAPDATPTVSVPSQPAPDASGPDAPAPGRFVLTPALRVVDAVHADAPLTSGPLPLDILPHADVLRALSDTDATATDGFDFDTSDFEVVGTDTEAANLPAAPEHLPDVAAPASPDRKLRLADTAAGLEMAITAQRDTWEPDGSEDVPVMDWSRTAPEDGPIFRSRHLGPLRLEQYARTAPPTLPPDEPLTFRHTPAVVEKGVEEKIPAEKVSASDDVGDDPDGVTRFESEADSSVDDDLAAYIAHSGAIDEDLLRKLVIEIVHQELQGTLGERITRNVRKLVLREIQRALSSNEYD